MGFNSGFKGLKYHTKIRLGLLKEKNFQNDVFS